MLWVLSLLLAIGQAVGLTTVDVPITIGVHGGFRMSSPDTTLYKLNLVSWLEAFVVKHDLSPANKIPVHLWVDSVSFEDHLKELHYTLIDLERFVAVAMDMYPFLAVNIRFSHGIAESYLWQSKECLKRTDCRYVVFLEDDWMMVETSIHHSIAQITKLMDDYSVINYVRFNRRQNVPIINDSPCLTEDVRLPMPMTSTSGFSNNPHISRAAVLHTLVHLTYDALSINNWGLEEHSGGRDPALYTHHKLSPGIIQLCKVITYCPSVGSRGNFSDYINHMHECDYESRSRKYHQSGAQCVSHQKFRKFQKFKDQPNFDGCGLYLYGGVNGSQAAVHLDGRTFNPQAFWTAAPHWYLQEDRLTFYKAMIERS